MARSAGREAAPAAATMEPLIRKESSALSTTATSDEGSRGGGPGDTSSADVVKATAGQSLGSAAACAVAAAGAAASAASFVLTPAVAVYVAGAVCILHLPFVVYRERRILRLPTLRNNVNVLREQADALEEEMHALEEDIAVMRSECSRFDGAERNLNSIARRQGHTAESVVDLVRQNEETLGLMRDNLRRKVTQDVIRIILRSDRNNTQRIDAVDSKLLALKITVQLEAYGIAFNEVKFMRAVALNPTLPGVIGTVRRLLPDDDDDDDDGHHDGDGADDDDTATVRSHLSRLSRRSLEDEDDVYDMFCMNEDESGSVAGLTSLGRGRGRRVSLAPRRTSTFGSGASR